MATRPRRDAPSMTTSVIRDGKGPVALRVRALSLEVVEGPAAGKRTTMSKRELTVGSHASNDLVIEDPAISRFHFRIVADEKGHRIVDTTSTNGTTVNGVRVEQAFLADHVRIQAGSSTIVARLGDGSADIELSAEDAFGPAVGRSVAMREVFALARRAAGSSASILLLGETGTGKDVLARAIHVHSARADKPFVVFDCAATPPSLIESALFGHVRGAFTGADEPRLGVFERASGGTLFLDEIGELPLDLQPKLLRALDGGVITPVGASREVRVSVRVIAATNRDLRAMVAQDRFRPDLYYRLAVVPIEVPPLRERRGDIPLLAAHFARQFLARDDRPADTWPAADLERAFAGLEAQEWPGNVRELRNAVERMIALADPDEPGRDVGGMLGALGTRVAIGKATRLPMHIAREQFDRDYIREILAASDGDVERAAALAELHPKSLERLMRRHGIGRERG
ncbi:MAG TPA: sigma 54-interacting transcriptional regulator [Kofleriaceae bacterium]|nr:sigma 54-interacting transcriptional regulator [Kofleriaceae bacterium]